MLYMFYIELDLTRLVQSYPSYASPCSIGYVSDLDQLSSALR
jgi:hypothetical protein